MNAVAGFSIMVYYTQVALTDPGQEHFGMGFAVSLAGFVVLFVAIIFFLHNLW